MGGFGKDAELVVDLDRGVYSAPSREDVFKAFSSLVSGNDYFGSDVPSSGSERDGSVAFWKLVGKSAEWYSLVISYVSLVSNQAAFRYVGSSFLDAVGELFAKRRIRHSDGSVETDVRFKARIGRSRSSGTDFVGSILSRVYENETVSSCLIEENALSSTVTRNGVDVDPHSIYLAVDGDDGDEENMAVATALWKAKDCGCGMTVQKPTLANGLTYRGESITTLSEGATTSSLSMYGRSTVFVPSVNDVVLFVPKENTVNRGVLYKWDGAKWTNAGLPDSNVRRVRFQGEGVMPFSAVVNRVTKKKFYVRAFVRRGSYSGDDNEIREVVKRAVVSWQEGEVDTVDGLGVGQDALRYECGNAISHSIPEIKVVEVLFYSKTIDLYGSYHLLCDYMTAADPQLGIASVARIGQQLTYTPANGRFSISYQKPQAGVPAEVKYLTFVDVENDYRGIASPYDSTGVKAIRYRTNVLAYTVPAGALYPVDKNFIIYRNEGNYYYGFDTLQEAFDNARDQEHIYMAKSVGSTVSPITTKATLSANKEIWLDISGTTGSDTGSMTSHLYTCLPNATDKCAIEVSNGTLHIIDSVNTTAATGCGFACDAATVPKESAIVIASGSGTVIVDGVCFRGAGQTDFCAIDVRNGGTVRFNYGRIYGVRNGKNHYFGDNAIRCLYGSGKIEVHGGYLYGKNGTISKSDTLCDVMIDGGEINSDGYVVLNNTSTDVTINGGVLVSSGMYSSTVLGDENYGYAYIVGGKLEGTYIGNNMNVSGVSRLVGKTKIWLSHKSGVITSGYYKRGSGKDRSDYVTGTQVWDERRSFYRVGGAAWVEDSVFLGNQQRTSDYFPPVPQKPNVAEARNVYEDVDVHLCVKDVLSGNKVSTITNDGVTVLYYVGDKATAYSLPSVSPSVVPANNIPNGESRLCGEVSVVNVTNGERAYCSEEENGSFNTGGIEAFVQEDSGKYENSVTLVGAAIDTYYVPSVNTKIELDFQFSTSDPPSGGQMICGFTGIPLASSGDNTKRYMLFVDSVSSGNAVLKWAIGNQVTSGISVPIATAMHVEVTSGNATNPGKLKVTVGSTTSEASIVPSSSHDYEINSIRLVKEAEIAAQGTCTVTVSRIRISEGGNLRMDLRPYITSSMGQCLKDDVSGMMFGG